MPAKCPTRRERFIWTFGFIELVASREIGEEEGFLHEDWKV